MEKSTINKPFILCVDDEKIVLNIITRQLNRHFKDSYLYLSAESGEEALDIVNDMTKKGHPLVLVITDQIMPGLSGDQLLTKIHDVHPEAINIVLTGQASLESAINSINNADLFRYLVKPWTEQDLITTVEKGLKDYFSKQKAHQQIDIFSKIFPTQIETLQKQTPLDSILLIDNYDSFVYNLFQYLGEMGQNMIVSRNDKITVEEIEKLKPTRILISPGPCTPNEAGISLNLIRHFAGKIPILGVCLGHQAIGQAFGGDVVRAKYPMHGKTSQITHTNEGVFKGIKNPLTVTRYHSLIVKRETLPSCLEITAETSEADGGEIMGFKHKEYPIEGVQFHPEAILTEQGHDMLWNFLKY